jgi:hypothetical protein
MWEKWREAGKQIRQKFTAQKSTAAHYILPSFQKRSPLSSSVNKRASDTTHNTKLDIKRI